MLSQALAVGPGARVLSIASAGDNALSLLVDDPESVLAVDLNPAQLACLALRVAAFRTLAHGEVLELVGARPSGRRAALYARCRPALGDGDRAFWDARPRAVASGIGTAGTFEHFFRLFRRVILPLAHRRSTVERLLAGAVPGGVAGAVPGGVAGAAGGVAGAVPSPCPSPQGRGDSTGEAGLDADRAAVERRRRWYDAHWDSARWRLLFRVATSRGVLGRARYPTAFSQVEGGVAERLLARVRQSVTATDPARNPYLQAALTGAPGEALPRYLRPEHYDAVRDRLDRLSWRLGALDAVLAEPDGPFTHFNLSDVFEYLTPAQADALFARVADAAAPGARLAYWNVLADRQPSAALRHRLVRLDALADALHATDRAPFYSAFHVDEVHA